MRVDVKPLTYWIIHQKYTVRFGKRSPQSVQGIITTPERELDFDYNPDTMTIRLPDKTVEINQHGWEIRQTLSNHQNRSVEDDDN